MSLPRGAGIAGAALLFVALASWGNAADSITYDEGPFLHYGLLNFSGPVPLKQVFNSKLPVVSLHAAPAFLIERATGKAAGEIGPDGNWHPASLPLALGREVGVLLGAALVVALGLFAWSLFGEGTGSLVSFLAALEPSLLAHAHYVTADGPAALATFLFALALLRCARTGRARDAALAGGALGLALLSKYTLVVLAPLAALALVVRRLVAREGRPRAGKVALHALVLAAATLVTVALGFFGRGLPGRFPEDPRSAPIAALEARIGRPPLPIPRGYLEGLDWTLGNDERGTSFGNLYLLGEVQEDRRGFLDYYAVVLAVKLPMPILALLLVSLLGAAGIGPARATGAAPERAFFATLGLGFLVFLSVANRAQIGVRHALPVFPFIIIEAGLALAALARAGRAGRLAASALGLWLVASVGSFAPDFLPYTNELIPDRRLAWRTLADSNLDWGQADGELVRWLDAEARAGRRIAIAPKEPVSGRVVVSVNALTGVSMPPGAFAWLRELEPTRHVGHAYLVFDVTPEEAARARSVGPR